jgi:hypothetical protein
MLPEVAKPGRTRRRHVIAWPLVLVKIPLGNGKDGNKDSPRHSGLLLLSNGAKLRA